jgi:hypothetical protein
MFVFILPKSACYVTYAVTLSLPRHVSLQTHHPRGGGGGVVVVVVVV